jgi:hypothetical protein
VNVPLPDLERKFVEACRHFRPRENPAP